MTEEERERVAFGLEQAAMAVRAGEYTWALILLGEKDGCVFSQPVDIPGGQVGHLIAVMTGIINEAAARAYESSHARIAGPKKLEVKP